MRLSLADELTYSTVRIECELPNNIVSTGTGFIYHFFATEPISVPVLVSNKHVIANSLRGKILLHHSNGSGGPLPLSYETVIIDEFEKVWIPHPDPFVDLAILPLAPIFNQLVQSGKKIFYRRFERSLMASDQELASLTAMEDIVMIGYPNGIWDSVNNKPIIRRGVTATHPHTDYNGIPEFLIDAAVFPGSSGSPVVLYNQGGYIDENGNRLIGPDRFRFLGIVRAVFLHSDTGEVQIVPVPINNQMLTNYQMPNNIGIVIKATRLNEFEPLLKACLSGCGVAPISTGHP